MAPSAAVPVADALQGCKLALARRQAASGNGNKRRSAAVWRCVRRAAGNVNGNEEPPDAKRRQVSNKGMQLTRGAWSWCILSCRLIARDQRLRLARRS